MPRWSWIIRNSTVRFWANTNKSGPLSPICQSNCWVWTGHKLKKGYGVFSVKGKHTLAHRHSWELHNEVISLGVKVLHRCDNASCVNPSHLFLGSYDTNNKDRHNKGRDAVGEQNGKSVLTEEIVREARKIYESFDDTRKYGIILRLFRKYNVHVNTLAAAIHRRSWRHIL